MGSFAMTPMPPRNIGFEFEFPAVMRDGHAAPREKIKAMWKAFCAAHPQWHLNREKIRHTITGVRRTNQGYTEILNSDGGVCTVEFSLRPWPDVHQAIRAFTTVFEQIKAVATPLGISFLAMGMQPITGYEWEHETQKDWYFLLNRKLPDHHYAVPFASHQTSVDIRVEEWVDVVNMLSALSGPMIALSASSPLGFHKLCAQKEMRLQVWKDWNKRIEPKYRPYFSNSMPAKPFKTVDDYIRFYWNSQLYFVTHGKSSGYEILGNRRWIDFLRSKKPVPARGTKGKKTALLSTDEMLNSIHQYGWLTTKVHYTFDDRTTIPDILKAYDTQKLFPYFRKHVTRCYIENRGTGVAAKGEEAAMPAMTLGLIENLKKSVSLWRGVPWNEWKKIREDATNHGLDFHYKPKRSLGLIKNMLAIAEEGLMLRKLDEEAYLEPLKLRLNSRWTNADEIVLTYKRGGLPLVLACHGYRPDANEVQHTVS